MSKKKQQEQAEEQTDALVKAEETGVVKAGHFDYGEDAQGGLQNIESGDLALPWLTILQSLSPQVVEKHPGCEPGAIFNTGTEETYPGDDGVVLIPCYQEHSFIEWCPRDKGGGFVGVHAPNSPIVAQAKADSTSFGKYTHPESGNDLVETYTLFALRLDDEGTPVDMAALSFKSTGIQAFKKLLYRIFTFGGGKVPLFANRIRMTTVLQKNNKGSFYNAVFRPACAASVDETTGEAMSAMTMSLIDPASPVFAAAKKFSESARDGLARVDRSTEGSPTAPADEAAEENAHF